MRSLRQAVADDRFEGEGWRVRKDGSRFRANVVIHPNTRRRRRGDRLCESHARRHGKRQAQDMLDKAHEQLLRVAENGSRRPAHGRSGARLQQSAHHRHRQSRNRAAQSGRLERGIASRLNRSLDRAMRGARRAAILTERLLAFSRQQPLDPKPVAVNEFIAAEVEFLQTVVG